MAKVKINNEKCKGCNLCVIVCPKHILKLKDKVNKKGFRYIEVIDEKKCIACGFCYLVCPDCVIEIEEDE